MKKVAVLLSGCGHLDGGEIRESILTLLALDTLKIQYDVFSLDEDQYHVINHVTGEIEQHEKRNTLKESARIARGNIEDIAKLDVFDYSALIIPGGFGAAKNLCSFAFDNINASVNPTVLKVINDFYSNKKPIGAICISPALIALVIGSHHPTITLGTDAQLAQLIEKTGVIHNNCTSSDCVIDENNRIVSTPAYMNDDSDLAEIYLGISKLVQAVIRLI